MRAGGGSRVLAPPGAGELNKVCKHESRAQQFSLLASSMEEQKAHTLGCRIDEYQQNIDVDGIRTHANEDWCLKPATYLPSPRQKVDLGGI